MDKLGKRLREDAARIDVSVSDELDHRIEASLRAVTPEAHEARDRVARPPLFWWASTITGVVTAAAVIAVLNWQGPGDPLAPMTTPVPRPAPIAELAPLPDLKTEAAMLTAPLQQELEDLQSDLRKAEEKVKRDIGL
jgi:hypothetical protein